MPTRITITQKKNGRLYLGMSVEQARELINIWHRTATNTDIFVRFQVANSLTKLETLLRKI